MERRERGQVLVLIILAIVGLLGFAALAVDGGHVYAERRRAQSAADTAAYAAAFAAAGGEDHDDAALAQAGLNGFNDTDPGVNPGLPVDVQVYNPPVDGPYNSEPDFFQVKIRTNVDQIFSQFVYHGPLVIEVEAVTEMVPSQPISGTNAIVANTPNGCKGIWFHGGGETTVSGGNIFSNSDREGVPASCYSLQQGGTGNVTVTSGGLVTPGQVYSDTGTGVVTADFIDNDADPITVPDVDPPDCSLLDSHTYSGGSVPLEPGWYPDGINLTAGANVHLKPGLYCIDDGFTVPSGRLTGYGVTIVVRTGDIRITGPFVDLRASSNLMVQDVQWGGMLLFMPEENNQEVFLGGSTGSTYSGSIFAPGPRDPITQDKCILEGSGDTIGFHSSIYCYSIRTGGDAVLTIEYDPGANFHTSARMSLSE